MDSDGTMVGTSPVNYLDVAIIGGGISGVYVGWRLTGPDADRSKLLSDVRAARGGAPLRVKLFERSDRIGGRLWSVVMPGLPDDLPAEVGGMRFLEQQTRVWSLINAVGLQDQVVDFPFGDPNDIQYLRRKQFRLNQYNDPSVVPYSLPSEEQGRDPDSLLTWAIQQIAPEVQPGRSPAWWEEFKRNKIVHGKHLYEWGFWNLLADALSVEGYNMVADAGGYYSLISNWNAAEAMEEVVGNFPGQPQYKKLKNGYQQLPLAVFGKFLAQGGLYSTNRQVSGLQRYREGGQELIAFVARELGNPIGVVYYAKHVVLAMPRRSLELILPDSPLLANAQFRADLRTVTAEAASKLFLSYDSPWWKAPPISITLGGRSDTDLPLRQCYYWGSEYTTDDGRNPSLLMASYNDDRASSFWDGYLSSSGHTVYLGMRHENLLQEIDPGLQTTPDMVAEIQRQLRELHAPGVVPDATGAIYHDWRQDPYGGGWHFWNPHVRSWEVMPRIQHPIPDANLYVCGEAYSTGQGWVEGALQTADQVLGDRLGVAPLAEANA